MSEKIAFQDLREPIARSVTLHLPGRSAQTITDRGEWVRWNIEVTLDNAEVVFFKLSIAHTEPGWLQGKQGECHERDVSQILEKHGLQVIPPVLVVDHSREIIAYPYIIQRRLGGRRLGDLIGQVDEEDARQIYTAVGRLYSRMHAIQGPSHGLWDGSTPEEPWGDPTVYLYQNEIIEGSGKEALQAGRITSRIYERLTEIWGSHLDYLRNCKPSLVHYSPFLWNIYLEPQEAGWQVVKILSAGDFLWWDAAFDVACLLYPPFGEMKPAWREAFEIGYGPAPERKRILLYAVLERVCSAMGHYWEPKSAQHAEWAAHALDELDGFLDEIEVSQPTKKE